MHVRGNTIITGIDYYWNHGDVDGTTCDREWLHSGNLGSSLLLQCLSVNSMRDTSSRKRMILASSLVGCESVDNE